MTITNESGGRVNVFANEPKIDVITSKTSHYSNLQFFALIAAFALISIISIFLIV